MYEPTGRTGGLLRAVERVSTGKSREKREIMLRLWKRDRGIGAIPGHPTNKRLVGKEVVGGLEAEREK
jgi:hypothetical protein